MGQCKLISQIFWCRKWAHARTLHKGFQTAMGQLKLISNIRTFNPCGPIQFIFPGSGPTAGPHKSLVQQPIACWIGQCELMCSLPKYYCVGSGPMRGLCIRDFRLLWANSNSSVTSVHLIHGPIQLYFPAAVLLHAHARVSCGSPLCAGCTNVSSLPLIRCWKWPSDGLESL